MNARKILTFIKNKKYVKFYIKIVIIHKFIKGFFLDYWHKMWYNNVYYWVVCPVLLQKTNNNGEIKYANK